MIFGLPEEEYFASGHRACAGCGSALALRIALKAAGKNTIVLQSTGCMEVVSTPYPQTAWKLAYLHAAFENAAAVASGVSVAYKKLGKKANILVFAGDGGTFDIGLQALSGAFERGHNICYICNDNGAYMNTGIQRSGATPKYAATTTSPAGKQIHGNQTWKKPMPLIVAAHRAKYVATASVADILDLYRKVQKALKHTPSYIQIFAPCPVGWRFDSSKTIKVAKLALQSRVSPLYEIENGILRITHMIEKPIKVEEYLKMQGRFRHLQPNEIKEIQNHVDKQWDLLLNLHKNKVKLYS